jgi:hypothetical protein
MIVITDKSDLEHWSSDPEHRSSDREHWIVILNTGVMIVGVTDR